MQGSVLRSGEGRKGRAKGKGEREGGNGSCSSIQVDMKLG